MAKKHNFRYKWDRSNLYSNCQKYLKDIIKPRKKKGNIRLSSYTTLNTTFFSRYESASPTCVDETCTASHPQDLLPETEVPYSGLCFGTFFRDKQHFLEVNFLSLVVVCIE